MGSVVTSANRPNRQVAEPVAEPVIHAAPTRSSQLPFDILDHIFSFLKFHRHALAACSRVDPTFSEIVAKYRFRHIIITGIKGGGDVDDCIYPWLFRNSLAGRPWIANYVIVLQIECKYVYNQGIRYWEEIALLLPMLSVLECLILPSLSSAPSLQAQDLPQSFRSALDNCLQLPTLQEVHIRDMSFSLSILDNRANINSLTLSGPPEVEREFLVPTTYPHIKSLTLQKFQHDDSQVFRSWAKQHIVGLRSLTYDLSCHEIVSDVFKICSNTLESLHICLSREGTPERVDILDLSSLPCLQHLTLRAECFFRFEDDIADLIRRSFLPKAVQILETALSLHQLTVEFYIDPRMANFEEIDLSPLNVLTKHSTSFPHVDLFVFTASTLQPVTPTIINSWLATQEGLKELIKQGVLVVHPEESAPTSSRSYIAKENLKTCIIM